LQVPSSKIWACVLASGLKDLLWRDTAMHSIFYIIGVIVVIIVVLSFLGVL
jgi:hypothetical protein